MPAIRCAGCQTVLGVKDEQAGTRVRCPNCQRVLLVPPAAAAVAPPPQPQPVAAPPPPAPVPPPPRPAPPPPPPAPPARRGDEDDPLDRPGYPRLRDLPREPLPEGTPRRAGELGEPLATMVAPDQRKWAVIGGIGCLAVGAAMFFGSMSMFAAKIDDPKKRANNDTGKWITLVFSVVMLGMGAGSLVLMRFIPPGAKMWLCPAGLVWERGGNVRSCRWEEVKKFLHSATKIMFSSGGVGERCTFDLTLPGGEVIYFESGGNSNEATFGHRLHHEVTKAVLPVLAERLRAGERLDFDIVKMNEEGLRIGRERLRWEDITGIDLEQGVFQVRGRGGDVAAAVAYSAVSHALAFRALAQERIEGPRRRG